jgi:hypothetical protein
MNIRFKHFLMALLVLLAFFLLFFFSFGIPILGSRPVVQSLEPVMVRPGDKVLIRGTGFGRQKQRSKILVAGQVLSASAIGSWTDREIEIVAPDFNRSTLISVKTLKGESPSMVLINAGDFPVVLSDPLLPGYPYISFVTPQSGAPGSLMEIHGQNFGNIRNRSKILVPRVENYNLEILDIPEETAFIPVEPDAILHWSDHLIRFVLPGGAVSGPVVLSTSQGFSNPFTIELAEKGYKVRFGEEKTWNLRQEFRITQIAAYPGNTLWLWLPEPVESVEQTGVVITGKPDHDTGLKKDNCRLVRMDEISTREEILVSMETAVNRREITIELQPWLVPAQYGLQEPAVKLHSGTVPGLSAEEYTRFVNIAAGIVRGESHPLTKARLIYDFVMKRFSPTGNDDLAMVKELPADQLSLDSRSYALVFVLLARGAGIPARPVSGILLSGNPEAPDVKTHAWAEFWLEGGGWFPVDPWLADTVDKPDLYWGHLDADRVAFSEGWSDTVPLQPGGQNWEPSGYSLQKHYAETEGNIGSLRIRWIVPSVIKP